MVGDDVARLVASLRELPFALRHISESDLASGDADRARRVARDAFHALAPFDEPAWTPVWDAEADDTPARASARLLVAFLAVVKYPPARDDDRALVRAFAPDADAAAGDADAAVAALARAVRWVVAHHEQCATRAHVAHHIADVAGALPVEMRGDPAMAEALEALDRARRGYVAAHKTYRRARTAEANDAHTNAETEERETTDDSLRRAPKNAASLARAVADLEDEKDLLTKKIEAVERKIDARIGPEESSRASSGDGMTMASLAAAIREAKRVEAETRRSAASARERAEAADARRRRAAVRLRETLQSLGDEESPLAVLERLRAETERARVEIAETLPESVRAKREKERALAEACDDANLDENVLRDRAAEVNALTAETEETARFVETKENERDGGDPAARQQASLAKSVRAKRDAAVAARDRLAARVKRAEDAYETLEADAGGPSGGPPREAARDDHGVGADTRLVSIRRGVAFDAPASSEAPSDEDASSKRRAYETLKPRLDAANAESATLARTVAILRDQLAGVRAETARTREGSDDAIGAGPTRASAATKASLAPRVAELREKRAAFAALERAHEERRRAFDAAVRAHSSGHERLERETAALKNRVRGDERAFHAGGVERAFAEVSAERARGARGAALAASHERALRDAEAATEALRELDSNTSNAGERGFGLTLDQMGALRGVRRLIETRLRVERDDAAGGGSGSDRDGATRDGANVLSV